MNIHRIDSPPGYSEGDYTPEDFASYDIERLERLNIDFAVYWYSVGYYCGNGQLLMHSVNGWHLHDCGHCSCYGPVDELHLNPNWRESLDGIEGACSDYLTHEASGLFDYARKHFLL